MSRPVVRAAGGVLWRPAAAGVEVVVIHRPRYDDWSFPKGKAEPGEGDEACALREVAEEAGWVCTLGPELATVRYHDRHGRPKQVRYWAMEPVAPVSPAWAPGEEVDERSWRSPADLGSILTYPRDLRLLEAFSALGEGGTGPGRGEPGPGGPGPGGPGPARLSP